MSTQQQERGIKVLLETLPQRGHIEWIGIRPGRREPIAVLDQVEADPQRGLIGDRYAGRSGQRHVTLIQHEHLHVVASVMKMKRIDPSALRRNLVVSGVNLLALKDKSFKVGVVTLTYTGLCHPCSYMEEVLGEGGYNAMRGHGGITAKVLSGGMIHRGDVVAAIVSGGR